MGLASTSFPGHQPSPIPSPSNKASPPIFRVPRTSLIPLGAAECLLQLSEQRTHAFVFPFLTVLLRLVKCLERSAEFSAGCCTPIIGNPAVGFRKAIRLLTVFALVGYFLAAAGAVQG
jgi:hypothetical protein